MNHFLNHHKGMVLVACMIVICCFGCKSKNDKGLGAWKESSKYSQDIFFFLPEGQFRVTGLDGQLRNWGHYVVSGEQLLIDVNGKHLNWSVDFDLHGNAIIDDHWDKKLIRVENPPVIMGEIPIDK